MGAPHAPRSIGEIQAWAAQHEMAFEIARRRFIQAASVHVIAGDPELGPRLRLFGSAALSLLYGSPRTADDLDYWCEITYVPNDAAKRTVRQQVNRTLNRGLREFIPFDDANWRAILTDEIDVQLCADPTMTGSIHHVSFDFGFSGSILAVTLESALAMKLISMLRPLGPRQMSREHDIYDIAKLVPMLDVRIDDVINDGRRALRSIGHRNPMLAEALGERTRAAYIAKYERGELSISWDEAWPVYQELRERITQQEDQ